MTAPLLQYNYSRRNSMMTADVPAIVVGMCGHGLAISRALAREGFSVIGLESNQSLPSCATNSASVRVVPDINGAGLLETLRALHVELGGDVMPPLFLTNDRMVRYVGEHWEELAGLYCLSWSDVRGRLIDFLDKSSIEERCIEAGLNYPKSCVINGHEDAAISENILGFPFIVKPVKPLSSFKVSLVHSHDELNALVVKFARDLPFLAQQWIPGDDRSIFFGALYLKNGEVLSRFEGHKLLSRPMGHTTLAEPMQSDAIHHLALKFFEGLRFSGPVSLEVKQDNAGKLWVIEPTVGRTDFWVGLCIENGVNLPLIEYLDQVDKPIPPIHQLARAVWINGERDPLGLFRLLFLKPAAFIRYRLAFLYFCLHDPKPYIRSTYHLLLSVVGRANSWLKKSFHKAGNPMADLHGSAGVQDVVLSTLSPHVVTCHARFCDIPGDALPLFEEAERSNFDLALGWFDLLARAGLKADESVRIYTSETMDAEHRARVDVVLPLRAAENGHQLSALSTFYTALYSPILREVSVAGLQASFRAIRDEGWAKLALNPLAHPSSGFAAIEEALRASGWMAFKHFCFGNWYLLTEGRSYDDYYRTLPAKLRHTLERKRKKFLHSLGGRLEIVAGGNDLEKSILDYQKVYAASWKLPEPFPEFIPEFIRMCAAKGQLRLGLAYIGESPAAAQIWVVRHGRAAIYKLAYGKEFAHLSVGSVLEDHLMRHVFDVDCAREVDYLIGDDPYKRDWMSHRRERWGIVAYNVKTFRGQAGVGLEYCRLYAKRLISIMGLRKNSGFTKK